MAASYPCPPITPHAGAVGVLTSYRWAIRDWPTPVFPDDMGGPLARGAVEFVVAHTTVGDSTASARGWLDSPERQGAYHYTIDDGPDRSGAGGIWRHVPTSRVAYHAGRSGWPLPAKVGGKYAWRPRASLNGRSWGFSFANWNRASDPLTAFQAGAGLWLAVELLEFAGLGADRLLGHLEIAPDRKNDPHPDVLDMAAFRGLVAAHLDARRARRVA